MTKDDERIREDLLIYIHRNFRTQKEAAEYFDTSDVYMSNVIHNKKPLKQNMLDAIGYRKTKIILYEKVV